MSALRRQCPVMGGWLSCVSAMQQGTYQARRPHYSTPSLRKEKSIMKLPVKFPKDGMLILNLILLLVVLTLSLMLIGISRPTEREGALQRALTRATEQSDIADDLESARAYIAQEKWKAYAESMPREFPDTATFREWVKQRSFTGWYPTSFDGVVQLQHQALDEGWLINYELITNISSGDTEFWIFTKIGDELYMVRTIPPYDVMPFYPSDIWGYKKVGIK